MGIVDKYLPNLPKEIRDAIDWEIANPDPAGTSVTADSIETGGAPVAIVPAVPLVGQVLVATGPASAAWATAAASSPLPEKWSQSNVAASQVNVALGTLISINFPTIKAIRAGSIVGISTRFSGAITDATANSCVVTVTIGGVAGTLSVSHAAGGNASGGEARQLAGIDTFGAGALIGVQITTLASFLPISTDLEAWLDVQ